MKKPYGNSRSISCILYLCILYLFDKPKFISHPLLSLLQFFFNCGIIYITIDFYCR